MSFKKPISATVTQRFGADFKQGDGRWFYKQVLGYNGHNGDDYAAGQDTPVYAADEGTVTFEGWGQYHSWMGAAAGICVLVHNGGLYSGYAHLNSTVVNKGQRVGKGQLIGYVGNTGSATGPHLHFEAIPLSPNFNNGYAGRIDPNPYMETVTSGGKTVNAEDLDHIYMYGPLGRPRGAGEGEDVYLGKSATFVIADHRDSAEGRARVAELNELRARPREVVIDRPVEVIKEVIKEVPVERIKEVEVVREVNRTDENRSLGDLLVAAFGKLFKVK